MKCRPTQAVERTEPQTARSRRSPPARSAPPKTKCDEVNVLSVKIFISWSGEPSKTVARALHRWLPDVIQSVEPWMSELDLEAGARWNERVQRELNDTRFGIICVTPQNVHAPWLLFEAGALAKTINDTHVCPYLIGLEPSSLPQGPLTQFQAKRASQEETRDLIVTINQTLREKALDSSRVERGFDRCWPDLDKALSSLPTVQSTERRSAEDMLEEVLFLARKIDQQSRSLSSHRPDVALTAEELVRLTGDPNLSEEEKRSVLKVYLETMSGSEFLKRRWSDASSGWQ